MELHDALAQLLDEHRVYPWPRTDRPNGRGKVIGQDWRCPGCGCVVARVEDRGAVSAASEHLAAVVVDFFAFDADELDDWSDDIEDVVVQGGLL